MVILIFFQINGNLNGNLYRASTTEVKVYNARYLKINSVNENREFCLRIQLCGEGIILVISIAYFLALNDFLHAS